jgi:hypothetical protein
LDKKVARCRPRSTRRLLGHFETDVVVEQVVADTEDGQGSRSFNFFFLRQ